MSRSIKNPKKKRTTTKYTPDKVILTFTILIAIFGAIMIFDASVFKASIPKALGGFDDPFYFLKSQIIWLIVGGAMTTLMYFWDYRKVLKLSLPILIVVIILLVVVLVLGEDTNGAKRWFAFGPLPPIQPAEFAKLAVILYLASWMSKEPYFKDEVKVDLKGNFLKVLISFFVILGLVAVLIILEPDLGTTAIIAVTAFAMFFVAKNHKDHAKYSVLSLFALFTPLGLIAAVLAPYRLKRIETYIHLLLNGEVSDPRGAGYQMYQILIGIGSGGFFGKGFGQSRQRFGYLVESTAFTDSIFAVILEELGFLGGTILVIAWILFFLRGMKVANNAPDKAGKLLAIGISTWLTMQALLNMAANVGLIPLTGIPAPLLSYGGSSTVITLIGIGILLNISKYSTNESRK